MKTYLVKRRIRFNRLEGKKINLKIYKEFDIIGYLSNFGDAIDEFKNAEFGSEANKWVITQSFEAQDTKENK